MSSKDVMSHDDILSMLSPDTLAALNQFKEEVDEVKKNDSKNGNDDISEDFGMSQFWYDIPTRQKLAQELLSLGNTRDLNDKSTKLIACISAPSVFLALQEMNLENTECILLEYDTRFSKFGSQYVQYDFNHPTKIPTHLLQNFDCVIADPPYLNKECMVKTGETMRLMCKNKNTPRIFCTGAIMERAIHLILGLRRNKYEPKHASKLSNEFAVYTNYDSERFGNWLEPLDELKHLVKKEE